MHPLRKIELYDITGSRVATLTDRRFEAGSHQVSFDAGRLASGVYLVRAVMRPDEAVRPLLYTRKITLVK